MAYFREQLGIGHLETTADGLFSYEEVECLAACDRAPCMQVNLRFMYDLDAEDDRRHAGRDARRHLRRQAAARRPKAPAAPGTSNADTGANRPAARGVSIPTIPAASATAAASIMLDRLVERSAAVRARRRANARARRRRAPRSRKTEDTGTKIARSSRCSPRGSASSTCATSKCTASAAATSSGSARSRDGARREPSTDDRRSPVCAAAAAPVFRPAASGRSCPTTAGRAISSAIRDEAEPGTFKDHMLLEETPHQIIEGILIGAYAIGCHTRSSISAASSRRPTRSSCACRRRKRARPATSARGICGTDVRRSNSRSTAAPARTSAAKRPALLNSLEGKRGEPRLKPPFPAVKGLYGEPTVVNNVETLAYLPHILRNGAGVVRGDAAPSARPGFKIVSISRPREEARATTKFRSARRCAS